MVQTVDKFLERVFPEKECLITGLLYKRDLVCFAGRRRNGKTTFVCDIAVALISDAPSFLEYPIDADGARVLVFFLEDDSREIQDKLRKLLANVPKEKHSRLALYTRQDFFEADIRIDVNNKKFRDFIEQTIRLHKPDLIVFDNLAHMVGSAYNDATIIHTAMNFAYEWAFKSNAAIIIAAHPRKPGGDNDQMPSDLLRVNPDAFFDTVMGSSQFVNSTGSLWGLQRCFDTNQTIFCGGAQRSQGTGYLLLSIEKNDDDWFEVSDDVNEQYRLVINTVKREEAWAALPDSFKYLDAEKLLAAANCMKKSTFGYFFSALKQSGLITLVAGSGSLWMKASAVTTRLTRLQENDDLHDEKVWRQEQADSLKNADAARLKKLIQQHDTATHEELGKLAGMSTVRVRSVIDACGIRKSNGKWAVVETGGQMAFLTGVKGAYEG
jgi:hypothetical protein